MSRRRVYQCLAVALAGAMVVLTPARDNPPSTAPAGQPQPTSTTATPAPATREATPRKRTPAAPPRVILEIRQGKQDWGRMILELDAKHAPVTVQNFLDYVDAGFYDGTIFHRVISSFVVQGGGQTSFGKLKTEGLRPPIKNESDNGLKNVRGTIAMARRPGHPDSATSQFILNMKDNPGLDYGCPEGDGSGYCVFGRIVSGMNILDRFKRVPTRPHPQVHTERSMPVDPPVITRAYRLGSVPHRPPESPAGVTPASRPTTQPRPGDDPGIEPDDELESDPTENPANEPEPEPEPQPEPQPED